MDHNRRSTKIKSVQQFSFAALANGVFVKIFGLFSFFSAIILEGAQLISML